MRVDRGFLSRNEFSILPKWRRAVGYFQADANPHAIASTLVVLGDQCDQHFAIKCVFNHVERLQ
jgi:hypothetical protein